MRSCNTRAPPREQQRRYTHDVPIKNTLSFGFQSSETIPSFPLPAKWAGRRAVTDSRSSSCSSEAGSPGEERKHEGVRHTEVYLLQPGSGGNWLSDVQPRFRGFNERVGHPPKHGEVRLLLSLRAAEGGGEDQAETVQGQGLSRVLRGPAPV